MWDLLNILKENKNNDNLALVVAQLAERLNCVPKVRGSNSAIGKTLCKTCLTLTVEKMKNKEKRGREWPILQRLTLVKNRQQTRTMHRFRRIFAVIKPI